MKCWRFTVNRLVTKYDEICMQENINLYGGRHGEVKEVLENKNFIKHGHVEFSIGDYYGFKILSFMGSYGNPDWIDDFKFWKEKHKIDTFFSQIHHGIEEQWDYIYPFVDKELRNIDEVIFNGHSLGGGLAQRATLHYCKIKKCHISTFGSLRIMDPITARYFNKNVSIAKRFVYKNDIVAHVPTAWMNFCHVGVLIKLGKESFWDKINPFDNFDDHEPVHYLREIKKILTK